MIMSTYRYNYLCAPNYRLSNNIRGSLPPFLSTPSTTATPRSRPPPHPFSSPSLRVSSVPVPSKLVSQNGGDRILFRSNHPLLPGPRVHVMLLCSDVCLFMCYRFDERHYAFERYAPAFSHRGCMPNLFRFFSSSLSFLSPFFVSSFEILAFVLLFPILLRFFFKFFFLFFYIRDNRLLVSFVERMLFCFSYVT